MLTDALVEADSELETDCDSETEALSEADSLCETLVFKDSLKDVLVEAD